MISRRHLLFSSVAFAVYTALPSMAQAQSADMAVQAAKLALAGNFEAAGPMAASSGDDAAIKFVEMLYLRDHPLDAGYARINRFLRAAPFWPLTETLEKRGEKALYENAEPAEVIQDHFTKADALTPYGNLSLARFSFGQGDEAQGRKFLRRAWASADVDAGLEVKIIAEFDAQLSERDHQFRLWRLIYQLKGKEAVRFAKSYLGGEYVQAAGVAQSLLAFTAGADRKFSGLSGAMQNELAILFCLTRFFRKKQKFDMAREVLVSVPGDPTLLLDAEAWFDERRIIIRRSVGPNQRAHWKAAYIIAKNHGLADSDSVVEAEFLAGWIALRYLKNAEIAAEHFGKMQKAATTGTEKARALYWLGRCGLASDNSDFAKKAFKAAAKYSTVYYGQLAREQLGLGQTPEEISPGGSSADAQSIVANDELVGGFKLMAAAGTTYQLNIFLSGLARKFKSIDELNAVAEIAQDIGGTPTALRFAKACAARGKDLDTWAYPINGLPKWQSIGRKIEKSLVYALARQESEFDPNAGSQVGAQGLMQLMPGTAKIVTREIGLPFRQARLKDPIYNVQIGAALLANLVNDYNGSYVLTLIAYNAGPGRVRDWIDYYGDPRGGQVDAVDFVECIPFNETRQYVQKVMQNLHVYRSRLDPDSVRPMSEDLARG